LRLLRDRSEHGAFEHGDDRKSGGWFQAPKTAQPSSFGSTSIRASNSRHLDQRPSWQSQVSRWNENARKRSARSSLASLRRSATAVLSGQGAAHGRPETATRPVPNTAPWSNEKSSYAVRSSRYEGLETCRGDFGVRTALAMIGMGLSNLSAKMEVHRDLEHRLSKRAVGAADPAACQCTRQVDRGISGDRAQSRNIGNSGAQGADCLGNTWHVSGRD